MVNAELESSATCYVYITVASIERLRDELFTSGEATNDLYVIKIKILV